MQSPPIPAPAITACGGFIAAAQARAIAGFAPDSEFETGLERAFRRFAASMAMRVVDIMRRAIGADGIVIVAHVDENMRMVEGRQCADTHKFLGADPHLRNARLVVVMRRAMGGHDPSESRMRKNARNIRGRAGFG